MTTAMWVALLTTLTEGAKLLSQAKKDGLLPSGEGEFKRAMAAFREHQMTLAEDFDDEMRTELQRRNEDSG